MNQKIIKNFESNDTDLHEELSESLKAHAGYILITCGHPEKSGQMKVEMTYGGSKDLVNMLLDGAQELLDEAIEEEDSITEIIPL